MALMLMPVIRLSICPCGHPALIEGQEIGSLYWVDDERFQKGLWKCRGCGTAFNVPAVWAIDDEGVKGWLPSSLFDLPIKKAC